MLIDLPPSLETAITQKAQRNGMTMSEYNTNLLQQDIQKTSNPHDNGEMTAFYYDRERMDEALNAPRAEVPKSALKDLDTFVEWMENLKDEDFTEHS